MQAEIGIVYNPILEEWYTARAGQGAFCNGTKLQVTSVEGILSTVYRPEVNCFKSHNYSHGNCYCVCCILN